MVKLEPAQSSSKQQILNGMVVLRDILLLYTSLYKEKKLDILFSYLKSH